MNKSQSKQRLDICEINPEETGPGFLSRDRAASLGSDSGDMGFPIHPQDIEDIANPMNHTTRSKSDAPSDSLKKQLEAKWSPAPKSLQSLKYLYRIGLGPSSSHTMGPRRAAIRFRKRFPDCKKFKVFLFGSLAATGKGHLTDFAVIGGLKDGREDVRVDIVWQPTEFLPFHPNALRFLALTEDAPDNIKDDTASCAPTPESSVPGTPAEGSDPHLEAGLLGDYLVFSVGGGALVDFNTTGGAEGTKAAAPYEVYPFARLADAIKLARERCCTLAQLVWHFEDSSIKQYLRNCWDTMKECCREGLTKEEPLDFSPILIYQRSAARHHRRARALAPARRRTALVSAYALAVSEQNGSGCTVVTSPTCGSSGTLPGVLIYLQETMGFTDDEIVDAIAVAGLIGNVAKANASISGAELGCQAEIGVATAMAAGAACFLMGGGSAQIETAAESALEHQLGLTCDPIGGLVIAPCIERNSHAALRAIDAAELALMGEGTHLVSYDECVITMRLCGQDMHSKYRETALGGLAITYKLDEQMRKADEEDQLVKERRKIISQIFVALKKGSKTKRSLRK
eukprot:gnl/Dysnectes_brevis/1255_a1402_2492.p1 GENE.gnl/Dysnectes_brevis/1255_a1402_2492~~gnl/Dysnectes_brevis/1255_a1402_2492.p1  ORF type:complete len:571 (-),score=214.12 gnl/Dysnectes_brevis/1255_a1402_2492:60-1772(-)